MRRDPTPAEARLWRACRAGSLAGHKVRRQVPVGPFILDFAIVAAKLAVEVDGDTHADPVDDQSRTAWLEARGWRVLRFTNAEVMGNLEGVQMELLRVLGPLPQAGEGV